MPFTLAHPAIVFPLSKLKLRLSHTALIVGSMVPDFEFFFQMREVENIGHHWYGILLLDVPMAWILCYLFHGVLKNCLVANLPAFYHSRLTVMINFNWNQYARVNKLKVFFSILTGVLTHVFWDGFTHADGIFVQLFPLLSNSLYLGVLQIPRYYALQIIFSIIGMLIVQRTIAQQKVDINLIAPALRNKFFWPLLLSLFFFILFVRILGWPQYNSFWSLVMACMGAFIYAWIFGTLLFKKIYIKNR